jgi:hypothetical protein
MGEVIQIDEARIRDHLGKMVRGTVEDGVGRPAAEGECGRQRPMPALASLPVSKALKNTHLYLSDRHSRSINTLFIQRPRPSIEMRMPSSLKALAMQAGELRALVRENVGLAVAGNGLPQRRNTEVGIHRPECASSLRRASVRRVSPILRTICSRDGENVMVFSPASLSVTENPRTWNTAGDLNDGRGAAERNPVVLSGISFVAISSAFALLLDPRPFFCTDHWVMPQMHVSGKRSVEACQQHAVFAQMLA